MPSRAAAKDLSSLVQLRIVQSRGSVTTRTFWVYIMANTNGRATTIYTGVTNDLERRVYEHRNPDRTGRRSFTVRYRLMRLVSFEDFSDVRDAIAREKQIKGWRRDRKIELIESLNPVWQSLSDVWGNPS